MIVKVSDSEEDDDDDDENSESGSDGEEGASHNWEVDKGNSNSSSPVHGAKAPTSEWML